MVLAVDIGNSNICIGGLAGEAHRDILFTTRMVTRPRCTADEYAAELRFLLGRLKVDPTACEGVIVCSVVPGLTPVLAHALLICCFSSLRVFKNSISFFDSGFL